MCREVSFNLCCLRKINKIQQKQLAIEIRNWETDRHIGSKQVPREQKKTIFDLNAIGVNQKAVLQDYSMPQPTAANIVRRSNQKTSNKEIKKRKEVIFMKCKIFIEVCPKDKFKSLRIITAEFNESIEGKLSMRTVGRKLQNHGIQNYVAVTKPFLTINT